jgi:pyruvate formate lyase activating enzyme
MDIKAPEGSYERITRVVVDESLIRRSIRAIIESGIPHEFRTTYLETLLTPQNLLEIAALASGCERFYLQAFRPSCHLDEGMSFLDATDPGAMDRACALMRGAGIPVSVR